MGNQLATTIWLAACIHNAVREGGRELCVCLSTLHAGSLCSGYCHNKLTIYMDLDCTFDQGKLFATSLAGSYARDALGSQLGLAALYPHWHGVQSFCSPQECRLQHPVLPQGLPVPYLCVGGSVASLRYQVLRIVDGTFVY